MLLLCCLQTSVGKLSNLNLLIMLSSLNQMQFFCHVFKFGIISMTYCQRFTNWNKLLFRNVSEIASNQIQQALGLLCFFNNMLVKFKATILVLKHRFQLQRQINQSLTTIKFTSPTDIGHQLLTYLKILVASVGLNNWSSKLVLAKFLWTNDSQ